MDGPLVSIIIPCYNAARWLDQTIDSALGQTWPRTEVIVVDDGSTDRSIDVARRYAGRGVKTIALPHAGASRARNEGARAARGDYIQWLDADDLLSTDKVEAQLRMLEQSPARSVGICRWFRFRKVVSERLPAGETVSGDVSGLEFALNAAATGAMIHPGAWLTPRTLVEKAGPWDERLTLNDDGEYFCRLALASSGIRYCPHGETYVRSFRPESLSGRRDAAAAASQMLSVDLITGHLLAAEQTPRVRQACANLYQRSVHLLYPLARPLVEHAQQRISELGGSDLQPELGPRAARLANLIGWRGAAYVRRLRAWLHGLGARLASRP